MIILFVNSDIITINNTDMNINFDILPVSIYNSCNEETMLNEWDIMLPITLQNHIFHTLFNDTSVNKYIIKIGNHIFNPICSQNDDSFKFCFFVKDEVCAILHESHNLSINLIYNMLYIKRLILQKIDRNPNDQNFKQNLTDLLENIKIVQKGQLLSVGINTFKINEIVFINEPTKQIIKNRHIEITRQLELNSAIIGHMVGLQDCKINIIDYEGHFFTNKHKTEDDIFGCVTNNHENEIEIDFVDITAELEREIAELSRAEFHPPNLILPTGIPATCNNIPIQINNTYNVNRFPGSGNRLGSK